MKKIAILLFALILFAGLAGADQRTSRVDKLFAQWDKPGSPGCALAVIENGKTIYERGYGSANLECSIPITPERVFYVGSCSKQFTAMSVALLAHQGKLSLDDDIRKYVPEMPDYGSPITVRQLIHHTSGLRDYLSLLGIAGLDFGSYHKSDVLELIARQKELNFKPGDQYLYSNSGYFLLAVIVERVSGKSFREFTQENIFDPLGMIHTHFHDDYTMLIKNRASGYFPADQGVFRNFISTFDCVGSGGLFTSVEDLYFWDQNFYAMRVGGPDVHQMTLTPGILNNGEKLDYAFGLTLGSYKGLQTVEHGGALGGYRAEILRFPDQKFSVICLSNLGSFNPSKLSYQVADIYLADKFIKDKSAASFKPAEERKFIQLPADELKEKAGLYVQMESGTLIQVALKNEKLFLETMGLSFALGAVNEDEFYALEAPVSLVVKFEKPEGTKPGRLSLYQQEEKPVIFESIPILELSPEQLAGYAGDYFSDELQTTFRLAVKEGKLHFVHKNAPMGSLVPTLLDKFSVEDMALRFIRESGQKISGFRLDAGRVKNLLFVKK